MRKYIFLAIAVVVSVLLVSAVAEGSAFGWSKKTNINLVLKPPFIVKTTSTCTDTDSGYGIETGDNIIRYGTCVDDAGKHEDSCASPISLTEYTCSGGQCLSYVAYCPYGCESGECIYCGNGRKQGSEACDGNDFGGTNCKTAGFDSGTIYCTKDCNIDLSHCKRNQQDTTGNSQDQGQGQGPVGGNGQSGQGEQGQGQGAGAGQSQGYQQGCYDSDGDSLDKGFCTDKYGYHEDHCEGCNMPVEYECGIPKGETDYVCGTFKMQLQYCRPTCIYG